MEAEQKKQWKEFTYQQKWQYFIDYYLLKTAIIVGAVFIAAFLLWNYFKPQDVTILKVAVINETLDSKEKQSLQDTLLKQLGTGKTNEKVVIDDNYFNGTSGFSKLAVLMNAHEIDAIICDQKDFEMMAGEGYFKDMSKVLSAKELKNRQSDFVSAKGYLDKKNAKPDYDGTQKGDEREYGISIADSSLYKKLGGTIKNPVFAFTVGASHTNNARKMLQKLWS